MRGRARSARVGPLIGSGAARASRVACVPMSIVWILGSGFSKPLGGPLLDDLFSGRLHSELKASCTQRGIPEYVPASFEEFLYTRFGAWDGRNLTRRPELPWQDVEQFLERVERFAADPTNRQLGLPFEKRGQLTADDAKRMRDAAHRYFVLACHQFMPPTSFNIADEERWRPYQRWAEQLKEWKTLEEKPDVIITFNYDLVVERLLPNVDVWLPGETNQRHRRRSEAASARSLEREHHPESPHPRRARTADAPRWGPTCRGSHPMGVRQAHREDPDGGLP